MRNILNIRSDGNSFWWVIGFRSHGPTASALLRGNEWTSEHLL